MNMLMPFVLFCSLGSDPVPEKKEPPLDAKRLEAIWEEFAQLDDAGTEKALESVKVLSKSPDKAIPFLKERLKAVSGPDLKQIQKLIAELDSETFTTRDQASKALETLGHMALPEIERQIKENQSLELRKRLEELIGKIQSHTFSPDELRAIRSIEVLRNIGTPEAVAILENLAKGAEGAIPTVEAKKAVANLKKKP